MSDYSQTGEQAMILAWAERHGPGRWLDIGAADGVTASNTRALAETGWPGVAVEPAARQFDRLAHLYANRDDIDCVQAAITCTTNHPSPTERLIRFHYSHDLVSTTEDANAETWSELADFVRCYVADVSLSELFVTLPGPYDLVSIDTEGTSVELFAELRRLDAVHAGTLAIIEAEDGGERWEIQQACLEGWARIGTTPNNVLLERL